MRSRVAGLALACVIVVAGCGDDDTASTTTAEEPTTTTETSTTSTAEQTTTTVQGTACADTPLPAGASDQTSAGGDVDGDGTSDDSTVYRLGGEWHLNVQLSSGGGADTPIDEPSVDVAGAEIVGGVDVEGDGTDEVWAKVGAGASVELLGLYDLVGCDLVAATRGGAPALFPVGGSVLNISGVRCDDLDGNGALDFVVELSASSNDGTTFSGQETELAFVTGQPPTLTQIEQHSQSFTTGDPQFSEFARFQCGDLAR